MSTIVGDRDYWGRNILVELANTALEFIFEEMDAEKITGLAMARNLPTVFINKAMGLKVEAVLRKQGRMPDKGRVDVLSFDLLREDWRAQQQESTVKR